MNVFANGGDIYCASASSMFYVPVEKDGVNKELRAKGKVAELACGLIIKWHKSNPKICNFWRIMESCAKYAVRNKTFKNCRKGVLFIVSMTICLCIYRTAEKFRILSRKLSKTATVMNYLLTKAQRKVITVGVYSEHGAVK